MLWVRGHISPPLSVFPPPPTPGLGTALHRSITAGERGQVGAGGRWTEPVPRPGRCQRPSSLCQKGAKQHGKQQQQQKCPTTTTTTNTPPPPPPYIASGQTLPSGKILNKPTAQNQRGKQTAPEEPRSPPSFQERFSPPSSARSRGSSRPTGAGAARGRGGGGGDDGDPTALPQRRFQTHFQNSLPQERTRGHRQHFLSFLPPPSRGRSPLPRRRSCGTHRAKPYPPPGCFPPPTPPPPPFPRTLLQ